LEYDQLYYTPYGGNGTINFSIDSLEVFQQKYNLTQPLNASGCNIDKQTRADWASGTAYVTYISNQTTLAELTIIFPISDQLSSSSISTSCFIDECSQFCDYILCSLCEDVCPAERSNQTVVRATSAAIDNQMVINPIISLDCDYQLVYDQDAQSQWNNCPTGAYGPLGSNDYWCELGTCGGCNMGNDSSICFHDSCKQDILDQMEYMAASTGGQVEDINNIEQLHLDIENMVKRNIEEYKMIIGQPLNESRDVVEMRMPMPRNQYVQARLWVYSEKFGNYTSLT